MNAYEAKIATIRRAILLDFLEKSRDYTSNADILLHVINSTPDGVTAYYSDVIGDLRWLEAKGFVTLAGNDTVVCVATPSGLRIARREDRDEGIARDIPGV